MSEIRKPKIYDLEERTLLFARNVRLFVRRLPKNSATIEDGRQAIRSSGSTGANYIEANEAVSKKDRILRLKISRKEVKETRYWLQLLETNIPEMEDLRGKLIQEATEIMNILGTIIRKLE